MTDHAKAIRRCRHCGDRFIVTKAELSLYVRRTGRLFDPRVCRRCRIERRAQRKQFLLKRSLKEER